MIRWAALIVMFVVALSYIKVRRNRKTSMSQ